MDAKEKIIASIINEAENKAREILDNAAKDVEQISLSAQRETAVECESYIAAAQRSAKTVEESGLSGAKLIKRDKILAKKGEIIEDILLKAKKKIIALADKEYFGFLLSLVKKNATGQKGELILGKSDLLRNISEFEKNIAPFSLSLSKTGADIDGGFILKYGDIEINADISALIEEKRDILVDIANKTLF